MATSEVIDFVLNMKGDLAKGSEETATGLGSMGGAATTAAAAVAVVGAAVVAAGAALFSYLDGISDVIDETNTLGVATGLSNETIAGLRAAAVATGKSLSDLIPKKLSKNILDAAQGNKKLSDQFASLNISVLDAAGGLRSTDDVLRETLDRLAQVEDPTLKSGLAMQLLGKQGQQMLTAFENSAGLDKFVDTAEKYGIDVGPTAVAETGRWQSANAALAGSFTMISKEIRETSGVMGGFTDSINGSTALGSNW